MGDNYRVWKAADQKPKSQLNKLFHGARYAVQSWIVYFKAKATFCPNTHCIPSPAQGNRAAKSTFPRWHSTQGPRCAKIVAVITLRSLIPPTPSLSLISRDVTTTLGRCEESVHICAVFTQLYKTFPSALAETMPGLTFIFVIAKKM